MNEMLDVSVSIFFVYFYEKEREREVFYMYNQEKLPRLSANHKIFF